MYLGIYLNVSWNTYVKPLLFPCQSDICILIFLRYRYSVSVSVQNNFMWVISYHQYRFMKSRPWSCIIVIRIGISVSEINHVVSVSVFEFFYFKIRSPGVSYIDYTTYIHITSCLTYLKLKLFFSIFVTKGNSCL
jgi:hypothetical protein